MKVAFFPGCMVDMLYPEVGIAAVNVLEKLGCEVELPDDQVCCGQPFSNSGYIEEAKPMMKKVIDAYSGYDTIVSLTGSCAWAIKAEYPHFFADDAEYSKKIADLAPRIHEFTQFIVDVLGVTNVGAHLDGTVTYHKSCHLTRMLGVEEQPLTLLKNVEGLPKLIAAAGLAVHSALKSPKFLDIWFRKKLRSRLPPAPTTSAVQTRHAS